VRGLRLGDGGGGGYGGLTAAAAGAGHFARLFFFSCALAFTIESN
jgi:hypothetical protein